MPLGRTLLIVNPAARHGETERLLPALAELVGDAFPHDIVLTKAPGHALELARAARGYTAVVACGGDGTVHEVLNGVMSQPPESRPAMGLLPTGSGNDYRRTLDISTSLSEAVLQLTADKRRRVDVGVCNGRYFANSFSCGLDARVTARAVGLKLTTGRSGLWLYLTALFHVLFKEFYGHPVELTLDDAEPERRDMLLLAATNGPTYGGGFRITPHAVPDDGVLDVCLMDRLNLFQALWKLPFLIVGAHEWMPQVHALRHRRVVVQAAGPLPGQIDGEVVLAERYEIELLPGALEVLVGGGVSRA